MTAPPPAALRSCAAGSPEFGRHIDHVIVYPASFGMTDERSRQVTADLLKTAAPG